MSVESIPWWRDYRRQQRKPRKHMNIEMLLRKSFMQTLKEYTENSSIAGFKEMCNPRIHWTQRIVCILIFMLMFSTMCYILNFTWFGTLAKPLTVTLESSTYPISEIDFPAVALCNVNRISKKAMKNFAKLFHPQIARYNETVEQVEQYGLQAGSLIDGSYKEAMESFSSLKDQVRQVYLNRSIMHDMKELAPKCEDMLLKCSWAGKIVDCNSIFSVHTTVRGHCCAFNYVLNYDSNGRPNTTTALVKRQTVSGISYGLMVILDAMVHDYAYPVHNIKGFDVFLFDPTHYADPSGGRVIHRISEPNEANFFELRSIKQRASLEVRKYPFKTRKCLFHDELKQKFGEMYSYSACLIDCRMNTIRSLCKCTPYYMPANVHEHICTLDDLRCLNKFKEKLMYIYPINAMGTAGLEREVEDSLYCPDCLPDCELTQHYTKAFTYSMTMDGKPKKKRFRYSFLKDIDLTNKSFLAIYQSNPDGILNRLDVIAYWFEILSNVGGFGGILVGFSIICLSELFYFLSLRFIILVFINYRNYH